MKARLVSRPDVELTLTADEAEMVIRLVEKGEAALLKSGWIDEAGRVRCEFIAALVNALQGKA